MCAPASTCSSGENRLAKIVLLQGVCCFTSTRSYLILLQLVVLSRANTAVRVFNFSGQSSHFFLSAGFHGTRDDLAIPSKKRNPAPVQADPVQIVISRSRSKSSREKLDIPIPFNQVPRDRVKSREYRGIVSNRVISRSRAVPTRRNIDIPIPLKTVPRFS